MEGRLDTYSEPLEIKATLLAGNREGCIYCFSVSATGEELLSGKLVIAFPGE